MPYKSQAQQRFFNTATAHKKGITTSMIKEFDAVTKGKDLPKRADGKSDMRRVKPAAKRVM